MRCSRCGHDYTEWDRHCRNCNNEFWCEWRRDWYIEYWTDMSMGRNDRARVLGSACLVSALVLVLLAVLVYSLSAPDDDQILRLVGLSGVLIFSAYEVWAFTHGRCTSIDSVTHGAVPQNTGWRLFGLVLDFGLLMFVLHLFFPRL